MISLKKIGFLEILVLFSAFYVLSTLIWTASTRSSVQEKANLIKSNHQLIVNFVNNEILALFYSGFLGCFSTFSSFIYQLFILFKKREFLRLFFHYIEVIIFSFFFFYLGYFLIQFF